MITTSAAEVVDTFSFTPNAVRLWNTWRSGQQAVVDHVMQHVTRVPYSIDLEQVTSACDSTVHALGDVQKADIKRLDDVINWRPDFAMTHVFHYALENRGGPFTYQEFRRFCEHDPLAHSMLWQPAQAMVQQVVACGFDHAAAHDAMQWRIGCAYYSFLRELYTIVGLRQKGIDLRVHPLGDALFRVDAWQERTVVSLYIGNRQFREGPDGRKLPPKQLYANATPSFTFVDIRLNVPNVFGHVHLPSTAALEAAAKEIRAATRPPD